MSDLLETKEFECEDQQGRKRKFILSKFPAVAGRAICTQYPLTAIPKLGEYSVNEAVMLKLMGFVGVETAPNMIQKLNTQALIDNHVGDWETLGRVELAMIDYNMSFFLQENICNFFAAIRDHLPQLAAKILTGLSEQSSTRAKPPSTN